MRNKGLGYSAIAKELSLTKDNVKFFCRAHGLSRDMNNGWHPTDICRFCGSNVISLPHKKQRIFCSDKCRLAWWNSHPEMVRRKKMHTLVCGYCGSAFESKNPSQKFCSRACYGFSQRKEKENG